MAMQSCKGELLFFSLFMMMLSLKADETAPLFISERDNSSEDTVYMKIRLNHAAKFLKEEGPDAAIKYAKSSNDEQLQPDKLFIIDYEDRELL